jgi:hypothetical protein
MRARVAKKPSDGEALFVTDSRRSPKEQVKGEACYRINMASAGELASQFEKMLALHYEPGFGISPAAEAHENFYRQVWARDFAHAAAHYFIDAMPEAVEDSFESLLKHQRSDGALPLRVEKEYLLILKLTPGLRFLSRPLFSFLHGKGERSVFDGQDFSHAKDTIPALLIAADLYRKSSARGEAFVARHSEAFRRAIECAAALCGENGLMTVPSGNVDWADSIARGGALGVMNVLWVRALEAFDRERFTTAKGALLQELYDPSGAYFRAATAESRLDVVATVLGALFFLDAQECVRVEETLYRRALRPNGLLNFDPPYPSAAIRWPFKLIGHARYHNGYVWPWVFLQNTHLKIKIAREHNEETVRARYLSEAQNDLQQMADLFTETNGAYEIYFPDTRAPAQTLLYHPPRYFLASMAGFVSAERALARLLQSCV